MGLSRKSLWLMSGLAVLVAGAPQAPARAQANAGSGSMTPVCMVRAAGTEAEFTIILPEKDEVALSSRGFEPISCDGRLETQAQREEYRDFVCWVASSGDEGWQQQFEYEYGERANVLCGMAEAVVGQWTQGSQE